jgi:hypothetical protein
MKIFDRLFDRRDWQLSDRPARVRGPLVVIQINFFGFDTTGWLRGLLRRRRRALAGEAPRRISTQSSFVGGGRARALAELDARIEPSEPSGFDHGAAPVIDETTDVYGAETAWMIEHASRGRRR